MIKILKYEIRRLLFNKFFLGLLVINGIFAWYTLSSDTVAGIAYTAPFSPWSFGAYLSSVMPLIMITVLFLLTYFHSKKEKQVEVLTSATPIDAVRYMLIRNTAVTLGFLFLCLFVVGLCLYFYVVYFNYRNFAVFIIPALVTILPCYVFMMGAGHCIGRIHSGLLYFLMIISFAVSVVKVPDAFDLFGGSYYSNFPLTLPAGVDGEPAFVLSAAFLTARGLYLVIGIVLFVISVRPVRKK